MKLFLTILFSVLTFNFAGKATNILEKNRVEFAMATCFMSTLLFLLYFLSN